MGADVSISDLFLASALGAGARSGDDGDSGEPEKPASLSKAEIEAWAKLFQEQREKRRED